MSAQPAVLQVVILRDGLLVGTEMLVPGQYNIGSGLDCDVRLDDASISPAHATLYFQNGKAAIQDQQSDTGVFVNGHRVTACEVRSVDEVAVGPFSLKVRVVQQKAPAKAGPSPEVAAILGGAAPSRGSNPPSKQNLPPVQAAPPPPPQVAPNKPPLPATVVSARRMNTAPVASAEPVLQKPSHLKAVPSTQFEDETATESFMLGEGAQPTAELPQQRKPQPAPPPPPKKAPPAQKAAPVAKQAKRPVPPKAPYGQEGKGAPKLFFELYWGDIRQTARSFGTIKPKKPVLAGSSDKEVPAWGFSTGSRFVIADQRGGGYRVFIPPGAAVEKRGDDGNFYPLTADQLEAVGQRRYIGLANGQAIRLTNDSSETWMVAYVQPALPRPFVNPMRRWPWLNLFILGILSVGAGAFIAMAPSDELPDFQNKKLPPVAVKLLAPEKKKEREKKVEQLKKKTEEKKKVETKKEEVKKPEPKQEVKQTVQAIAKVEKVQKQMKDMLAAIDKLGAGPGAKNKTDYKLSGLIGKEPIANAGLGTFGLGGGGAGGQGFKGMENLRGKGIGALGAGNIGKGAVSGTVSHATSHNIGAQGTIDKEAVAKVINSHLHEVSACYERALLKTPGLAGKIVLEWGISTAGSVTSARTKSSSMKSAEVESCILNALKLWKFPPAKGAGVVISYPFMFNSVGF